MRAALFDMNRTPERCRVDLSVGAFYTDGVSNLPMLERIGEPRVVNPDPRLRAPARCRGRPIEVWR